MGRSLAAKVLGMRTDLIRDVRQQIDGAIDDSGDDRLDGAEVGDDGRSLIAEWVADNLIERGWVTEHADAGAGSPFEATDEDEDEADERPAIITPPSLS